MTPIWLSRSLAVAPWLSSWFGVLLIVLPLLGAFLSGCAASEPSDNQTHASDRATALPVASLRLEHRSSYTLKRNFVGRVEPARESGLGFELGGLLRVVQVDEGDSVKKGQMLAQLDVARLTARRQELQAALEEARANLALASITVRRLEGVVEAGGVSRQGLDEARERLRMAEAAVALAGARIRTVDVDLAKARLRAPFDGIVTRRLVDEGKVLAAGEPVLHVIQNGHAKVRIGVTELLANTLSAGQVRTVRVGGYPYPGRIKAILPVRGFETRTVDVILDLERELGGRLRAGDVAALALAQRVSGSGYWVPLDALAAGERALWRVYLLRPLVGASARELGATHEIVPYPVQLLHEESHRVFIQGSLREGALVVAGGVHRIVPGQRVRVGQASPAPIANRSTSHVGDQDAGG